MMHEFHPAAFQEYFEAVRAYEERQPGLGSRFFRSVELALESICESPERWPFLEQDIRRKLTRVFPYAVLYSIEERYILIVAVMHCHREPGYWHARIAR
jgi:plasmid stabilization system protein ParE